MQRMEKQSTAAEGPDTDLNRSASRRAAIGMLVSLARHSAELAGAVAAQGGLQAAVACLQHEDSEVREGAGRSWGHVPYPSCAQS